MALADFQAAIGRLVQAAPATTPDVHLSPAERTSLERLAPSAGLRLTAAVQRSWCEGRAARAARLTLSALPIADRQWLLERWIERSGGTSSFFAAEAEAFLTFIERHLQGRSHIRTLCQLERATIRAGEGAAERELARAPISDHQSERPPISHSPRGARSLMPISSSAGPIRPCSSLPFTARPSCRRSPRKPPHCCSHRASRVTVVQLPTRKPRFGPALPSQYPCPTCSRAVCRPRRSAPWFARKPCVCRPDTDTSMSERSGYWPAMLNQEATAAPQ